LIIYSQDLKNIVHKKKCDKRAAAKAYLVLELLIINQISEAHKCVKDAQHEVLIEDLDARLCLSLVRLCEANEHDPSQHRSDHDEELENKYSIQNNHYSEYQSSQ